MLSLREIISLYPEHIRPYKEFILREYLQYKILETIFESPYGEKLCFLGETALRIVHQNTRFSEDIDFDNFGLSPEDWEKLFLLIQKKLKNEGLEIEIRNIFKGAYHLYIRIPKLLYSENISSLPDQKILIQVNTVPQHFEYIPEKVFLSKWDVTTRILSTPPDLLLAQKFYASVNRKRPKGRDFYDILFLLAKGVSPNTEYLKKNIGVSNMQELEEYMIQKTKNYDWKALFHDVERFLWKDKDSEIKKFLYFPDLLKQAIQNIEE